CGSAILEVVTVDVLDTAGGLLQRGEGQQACPRRQEAFALPSFQLDTVVKGRCPRSIAVGHIGRKNGPGTGCHRRPAAAVGRVVAADVEPEGEEDLMAVEGVKRPVLLVGMDLRGARIAIAIRATPGALEISGALWISPLRVNSRSHRLATPTSHADGLGKRHS